MRQFTTRNCTSADSYSKANGHDFTEEKCREKPNRTLGLREASIDALRQRRSRGLLLTVVT